MAFSLRASCVFMTLLSMLLGGCASTQDANVKKDPSYSKQLNDTAVVWAPQNNFRMEIYRSKMPTASSPNSPPFITEQDKIEARKGISELMALFSRHAVNTMGKALTDARVHVHPRETTAATRLVIFPVGSISGCASAGCEHTLRVQVSLFDKTESKEVWSGTFKVGAPFLAKGDEALVKGFADAVIAELKSSGML